MSGFDINHLRAAITLLSFFSFIAIIVWAMSRRRQAGFDEAAQLPFAGEHDAGAKASTESRDE